MLVRVENLKLSIGPATILDGVQLAMQEGEIYGLLGPNGAGKSTTLSVLTGLRRADAGHVEVLGLDPGVDPRGLRRRIGVLAEDAEFYGWMTAKDYLRFMASLYGIVMSTEALAQRLAQVGLDAVADKAVAGFSPGMKQRLGLARALLNDPRLLILDEPTNGLDPHGRREIHDLLIRLSSEQGVGILLCTHLLDDVDRLCTRIGILDGGRTLIEGELSSLLTTRGGLGRYRLRIGQPEKLELPPEGIRITAREGAWVHLSLSPGLPPSRGWQELLDAGWAITEIHGESNGLEDLYLQLTAKEAVT
jgi:ABC-2 type transport system ATP-binding protein